MEGERRFNGFTKEELYRRWARSSRLHAYALAVAGRFRVRRPEAKSIVREVFVAVEAWRRTAARLRLKGAAREDYASATGRTTEVVVRV